MLKLTRLQWMMFGVLGLLVCMVWFCLGAFVMVSLNPNPSPTEVVSENDTEVPLHSPSPELPATWTPVPTVPPATATRVIPLTAPVPPATFTRVIPVTTPVPTVQRVIVSQQLISPLLPGLTPESAITSLDRRHVANLDRDSQGEFIVLDGKRGKTFERIDCCQIVWSPDSQHIAFVASQGNKFFTVVDGKEGNLYDKIFGLGFSPDSQHVIYGARVNDKSRIVVDGQEGKPYDLVDMQPVFSPDSKRVAYAAFFASTIGTQTRIVVDGKEGPLYEGIISDTLHFSPDSQHVAYAAAIKPRQTSFLNLPGYYPVAFQPQPISQVVAVVDGRESQPYDNIFVSSMSYSPNSQRLAYAAMKGNAQFAVIDGIQQKNYVCIGAHSLPIFSPDSRRVAYGACDGVRWFVVVDGKQEKTYDTIGYDPSSLQSIIFSPDSRRVAYQASEGSKWFVVVDGKEGQQYDSIESRNPFSPDSQHLAYMADRGKSTYAVIDNNELGPYNDIGRGGIVFSPDSRHIAYILYTVTTERVVIDGTLGLVAQVIVGSGDGRIVFDSADRLHYLAALPGAQPPGIYLIQEQIK